MNTGKVICRSMENFLRDLEATSRAATTYSEKVNNQKFEYCQTYAIRAKHLNIDQNPVQPNDWYWEDGKIEDVSLDSWFDYRYIFVRTFPPYIGE